MDIRTAINYITAAAYDLDMAGSYEASDTLSHVLVRIAQQNSWQQMQGSTPGISNIAPDKLQNSALGASMGLMHTPGQATIGGGSAHVDQDFRNIAPGETPEHYAQAQNDWMLQDINTQQNNRSMRDQYNQYHSQFPYIQDINGNWIPNPELQPGYSDNPNATAFSSEPAYVQNAQGQMIPNPAFSNEQSLNYIVPPDNVPDIASQRPITPYKF